MDHRLCSEMAAYFRQLFGCMSISGQSGITRNAAKIRIKKTGFGGPPGCHNPAFRLRFAST
jgi:hypothetical protein